MKLKWGRMKCKKFEAEEHIQLFNGLKCGNNGISLFQSSKLFFALNTIFMFFLGFFFILLVWLCRKYQYVFVVLMEFSFAKPSEIKSKCMFDMSCTRLNSAFPKLLFSQLNPACSFRRCATPFWLKWTRWNRCGWRRRQNLDSRWPLATGLKLESLALWPQTSPGHNVNEWWRLCLLAWFHSSRTF